MHTTRLTNPVIQVEIKKQGRIMGQKTARLHVSLSNHWSAYPTGGRLIARKPVWCLRKVECQDFASSSKIGIFQFFFAMNSSSLTFGLTLCDFNSSMGWDRIPVNLESWNQILVKGKVFFSRPKVKGKIVGCCNHEQSEEITRRERRW